MQRLLTDVARRNEDVPQSVLMSQTGCVGDILDVGQRLGVGLGDAGTLMLEADGDDILGSQFIVVDLLRRSLRNIVVLAVQTAEVAAGTGKREACRTGMEVV